MAGRGLRTSCTSLRHSVNHPALWQEISGGAISVLVAEIVREAIELIATRIRARNEHDRAAARSHAVLAHCALVGATGVARAVSDEQLSREYQKLLPHS